MRRHRPLLWIIFSTVALGLILATRMALKIARGARAEEECGNNLRRLMLGVRAYADRKGHYPPATVPNANLPPEKRLSWVVEILGDLDGGGPWLIDMTTAWDEGANRVIRGRDKFSDEVIYEEGRDRLRLVHCPSAERVFDAGGRELTSYIGVAGLGPDAAQLPPGDVRAGIFGHDRLTSLNAITDGTATTMAIAETSESIGPWKAGGIATVRGLDPGRQPYIGQDCQFGGTHTDGGMAAFADGSVRLIRATVDPKVFEHLSTIAGGERLPVGWER